jgi:hypothetical protein
LVTGVEAIKLFFLVLTKRTKKLVFVSGKPFHPSLIII